MCSRESCQSTTTGSLEIPPSACATQEGVREEAVEEVMSVSLVLNPPLPNRKLGQFPGNTSGVVGEALGVGEGTNRAVFLWGVTVGEGSSAEGSALA
jgi:hypothetical protein